VRLAETTSLFKNETQGEIRVGQCVVLRYGPADERFTFGPHSSMSRRATGTNEVARLTSFDGHPVPDSSGAAPASTLFLSFGFRDEI
jgi:hypothetical protein